MTIIDRYIVRSFLGGYLVLMVVGIGFYMLNSLLLNLDEFTRRTDLPSGEVLRRVLSFYATNIPLYYSQLAPPLMCIAAAFTCGAMLRNNELTALVAAGLPLQRLALPLMASAVLLIGVWVVNREFIMPPLAAQLTRDHADVLAERAEGVFARDRNDAVVVAMRIEPERGRLESVFILEPDASGLPTNLIEADEAHWDPDNRTWRLTRGVRHVYSERGGGPAGVAAGFVMRQPIDHYPLRLTPEELSLRRHAQWSDYLSVRQINTLLATHNLPNWPAVSMSRHVRLTAPLVQFILLLLPLPFFLTRERVNVLAAGGRALLVAGGFFLMVFITPHLVRDPAYAALLVWLPILVFGPLAVLQLANART